MPSRINATWHEAHKMPSKATLDQRVEWHVEHLRECRCRTDLPVSIALELERRSGSPKPTSDNRD
jgi:hypothetical protein